jgi:tRNA dimethylallyltransferase
MGPTASGKTALAVQLAKAIRGEVVSVDSALIYTDMDIGTAKPNKHEMQGIAHHLIDLRTPEQTYSVAQFMDDAVTCIDAILSRGHIPILAGGTMMYFNALHHGISRIPAADKVIRDSIAQEIEDKGLPWLHQQLARVDPRSAAKIHPNDPQRLTRAMEVFRSTHKTLSAWQQDKQPTLPYEFLNFALMPPNRADLHRRIAQRFHTMLDQGLVDEVKNISGKYSLNPDLPSMRSVGYRQVLAHIAGEYDYEMMVEKGIVATRQLAKRQITWLRGWENTVSLDIYAPDSLQKIMQTIMQKVM